MNSRVRFFLEGGGAGGVSFGLNKIYEPLQLTELTCSLQTPPNPHRVDARPLSWYPGLQEKEQVDP